MSDDIECIPDPGRRGRERERFLGGTEVGHVLVVDMDVATRKLRDSAVTDSAANDLCHPAKRFYYENYLEKGRIGESAVETLSDLSWGEKFTLLIGDTKCHSSFSTTRVVSGSSTNEGTICTKAGLEYLRHKLRGCDYLVVEGGHYLYKNNVRDFVAVLDSIVLVVENGYEDGYDDE
jgi:hypothetical protein